QQIEARRDAQIHHDHVRGLDKIVAYRHRLGGYIVLRQPGAVVGYVDGKRLGSGFFVPGDEGTAHHLVRKTSGAFETEPDRGWLTCVDTLEDELVKQVVVARGKVEDLHFL